MMVCMLGNQIFFGMYDDCLFYNHISNRALFCWMNYFEWNILCIKTFVFFMSFTESQVDYLRSHYHIYMMKDGRVSMCGVTSANVEYVANAFHDAVCNVK